jgi:hypothetical protein
MVVPLGVLVDGPALCVWADGGDQTVEQMACDSSAYPSILVQILSLFCKDVADAPFQVGSGLLH